MSTDYPEFTAFEWDAGNRDKNLKHDVNNWESEQVFFNEPLVILGDEDEERDFWSAHSPLDFFDVATAKRATFSKLKPSLKSISIRLPEDMDELKVLANKRDVPYQSLAKLYLSWGIRSERIAIKARRNCKKPAPVLK